MIDPNKPDFNDTPVSPRRARFGYAPAQQLLSPAVSIVTPFYNAGSEFEETVVSVLGQSLQDWEWLVVDDGSTNPSSLTMLSRLAARDPRVRILRLDPNRGLARARNAGYGAARSEFVFQLDADDLIEPTALEIMLWFCFTRPDCAFVKGYEVGFGAVHYLWTKGFDEGPQFLRENCVQPNAMVRKSVFDRVGGYDDRIVEGSLEWGCEDWVFWLKCADQGFWGRTLPEYLHWYRRRENHEKRWRATDGQTHARRMRETWASRYPRLGQKTFPSGTMDNHELSAALKEDAPTANLLAKRGRRLLLIAPHLEVGGADMFNLDLAQQLRDYHGYEITVVTTAVNAAHSWAGRFLGLTPDVFLLNRFLQLPDYPRFISYLVRSRDVDVVLISHSALGYELLPYLRAQFPTKAFVDCVHIEEEAWKSGGYPRMSIRQVGALDRTLATTRHLCGWMIARGHDRSKIRPCYTNVDTVYWDRGQVDVGRARGKWRLPPSGPPTILYAARLHEQKRPQVFAEIVSALAQRGWTGPVLVVGDGPEEERLRSRLKALKLRNVRLLGALSAEELREVMACSDILLLPSRHEGIALVAYEAMSMSMVPVLSRVGGQAELVTEGTGFLVNRDDGEVANYVSVLLELLEAPNLIGEIGRRARERVVADFRLESMAKIVASTFEEAIQLASSPKSQSWSAATVQKQLIEALALTWAEAKAEKQWTEKIRRKALMPLLINRLAHHARTAPLIGPLARRLETRYGTRLGRMLAGWI